MSANIDILIDKNDNFEIIRDEIAAILAVEVAEQKVLAAAAAKDPALWDFDVYVESSKPWELIEDANGNITSEVPLVNVFFDQETFVDGRSNTVEQQQARGIFTIDCLSGKNDVLSGSTIIQGDQLAARDVQRIAKLVRNILMSNIYTYIFTAKTVDHDTPIALRNGIVAERAVQSMTMFQPNINERPAQNTMGCRVQMQIAYNEFSPQTTGPEMELISNECKKEDSGLVYFQADFDTT